MVQSGDFETHPRASRSGGSTKPPVILRVRPEDRDLDAALHRAFPPKQFSAAEREDLRRRPTAWSPDGASSRFAVFVTHGMGQQLPFETAATVAERLIEHNPQFAGQVVPLMACNTSGASGRRQYLAFQARNDTREPIEIHVHEGYWAPLTEGRVHLRDVLRFLYSGALNSLRARSFTRYMFGRTVACKMPVLSHLRLLVTTIILSFFVLLNFVVACTLVGFALREGFGLQAVTWPSNSLIEIMNRIVALFLSVTVMFAVLVWIATSAKKRLRAAGWWETSAVRRVWGGTADAAQWGAWAWYTSIFVCFALIVLAILGEQRDPAAFARWVGRAGNWPLRVEAPFWLLMFVAFGFMRRKLVEFMGDVAAYVSPHVLDRFMSIRQDVKKWVIDAARDVYNRRRDGSNVYEYDGVILMGHSLGSVVAYDALNALLNEDEANGRPLNVATRTRLFLTFGSPLDKTAYIFSQHKRPFATTRGLMAMAVQPLICSYRRFRRIQWINVHSRRDPVCDALQLYDDSAAEGCADHFVRNVVDPEARVPLAAHVEYWDNACIYDQLWSGLVAPPASAAAGTTGARSQRAKEVTPREELPATTDRLREDA